MAPRWEDEDSRPSGPRVSLVDLFAGLFLAALFAAFVAWMVWNSTQADRVIEDMESNISSVSDDDCQEDDPCWQCEEDGNGVCGPVSAKVDEHGWVTVFDGDGDPLAHVMPEPS